MKKEPPAATRILLVDDNSHGLLARKLILVDHGYNVQTAEDGEEAWELFQANHYDIVVTDYRMPRADGLELIRRIRSVDAQARIVLLSAFLMALDERTCGADETVAKSSHEIPELLRALRKLSTRPRRRGVGSEGGSPTRVRKGSLAG